jgi:hypothetical protein
MILVNPLSAIGSCDARIGGCRQTGLLVSHSPFSQHPPIKRHCLPQWTSHYCISPMISKLKLTLSLLNICKIHYKMVFKVANGTERVDKIKDIKVLLDTYIDRWEPFCSITLIIFRLADLKFTEQKPRTRNNKYKANRYKCVQSSFTNLLFCTVLKFKLCYRVEEGLWICNIL